MLDPPSLTDLPARFREEAKRVKPYSRKAARAWRKAATALDNCLARNLDEVLSIRAAAAESGWHYEALRRRVVQTPELNAGSPGSPAIRRSDLQTLGPPRGRRRTAAAQEATDHAPAATPEGVAPPSTPFERIKQHALRTV